MRALFRVLVVWITLLALPLQGAAAASIPCCAPPVAAGLGHDHSATPTHDTHASAGVQRDHRPEAHHHPGKCTTCAACGAGAAMAASFAAVAPAPGPRSIAIPFDQRILASVDLAHPERPPRA